MSEVPLYSGCRYTIPWLAASYTYNLSLCTTCGTGTTVSSNTVNPEPEGLATSCLVSKGL